MATVNRHSLRTEFDALKVRFESLCAEGKMSADSRALVDALVMLFEVLMAVFMERHTPKSSANSSLPASQTPKPIAESQVTSSPWRIRVTTHLSPFKSLSPAKPLKCWVSR